MFPLHVFYITTLRFFLLYSRGNGNTADFLVLYFQKTKYLPFFHSQGSISYEEFRRTWKLLSSHLKIDISDKAIADLVSSIDFNKDGSIDINEFMEAFRLANLSSCG